MVRKQRIATRNNAAIRSPTPPPNGADEYFFATKYEIGTTVTKVITNVMHKAPNVNQLNLLATRQLGCVVFLGLGEFFFP